MSDLVERVARAMAAASEDYEGDELQWQPYVNDARAAIAVVLEDAAKVAGTFADRTLNPSHEIAAAIRALGAEQ